MELLRGAEVGDAWVQVVRLYTQQRSESWHREDHKAHCLCDERHEGAQVLPVPDGLGGALVLSPIFCGPEDSSERVRELHAAQVQLHDQVEHADAVQALAIVEKHTL
jgi:hypothetical protein